MPAKGFPTDRRMFLAAAAGTTMGRMRGMGHVVLLGDSVFDNGAYVGGGPDVAAQLRDRLPEAAGWRVTRLAVDGARIAGVASQLARLPGDATHLVVSAGGNDALGYASVLEARAGSVAEAVGRLADVRERFWRDYRAMLDLVVAAAGGTATAAVGTIYDGRLPEPRGRLAATALCVLNDCITREAFARGLPLLDLRLVCAEDADYANAIEPSARGGAKIAAAIAALAIGHDSGRGRSEVFARG
jgi:hypothetical protein